MFRRFSVDFAVFSIILDALLVVVALEAATRLRPLLAFLPFTADYPAFIPTPWPLYLIFSIEWPLILLFFSVYDGRRNLRGVDEFANLTLGSLIASVALAGTLYFSYRQVSRLLFLEFVLLAYLSMLAWRAAAWTILLSRLRRAGRLRKVLIVGAGPVGRKLQSQILANPQLSLSVAGFLDDSPEKLAAAPDILGPTSEIQRVVREKGIDDVVVALPPSAYQKIDRMVGELHHLPVKVWVIPDYFRLALHKAAVEEFAGIPMLDLRAPALTDQQRLVKRIFDLTVTIFLLPFALPLMGLLVLLIRLESRGPVIFRQQRVGENGRLFNMLKFRTMQQDAEQLQPGLEHLDGHGRLIHKAADDPRITRIGRLLRRASLDELPQLINVLTGEMSLVGPRPEIPYLVERYETWQRQRFAVPQGITGWWQIHGRSDRPMHLHTEDDLYYVQHYSLLLDIYILIKTAGVVLRGKGAF